MSALPTPPISPPDKGFEIQPAFVVHESPMLFGLTQTGAVAVKLHDETIGQALFWMVVGVVMSLLKMLWHEAPTATCALGTQMAF